MRNPPGGIRLTAFLIGTVLCVIAVFMAHYSISIVHGSYLAIDHMPAGGIFLFFVLVILINPVLSLFKRSFQLSPAELLIVFTMLLVTSSITTMGLGAQLLPILAAPFYYATPENRWVELVHPHLRSWLHPGGEDTIRHFFEGLPPGASIPWMAWVQPVLTWFILIFSLYMVMTFLMVILRKQWVEQEKLTYPLVQLPVEMVRDDEKQSLIKPLFHNKLFWLAFAIPMVISSINALHSYFHFIPNISLNWSTLAFQRTTSLSFRMSFPIMGFTYLVNQEIALGVWFFHLIYFVVRGIFNIVGISSAEYLDPYGTAGGGVILSHFGSGTFITLVVVGFWMARGHLKEVFGKAFGRRQVDDSEEITSYRTAVWGLIVGSVIIIGWLVMTGLSLLLALTFFFVAMVFYIGITRIVAETGIPWLKGPSISSAQMISSIGSANIGPQGMTALGLTYPVHSDLRTFPMVAVAHGLKMGDWIKSRRRGGMFGAIILAVFIAYFVSNYIVLRLAYTHGGINLSTWFFNTAPQRPSTLAMMHTLHPVGPSTSGWIARSAGIVLMGGLMFMRYRFLWWPFHPFGLAIGAMLAAAWFSIFIVWLIKAVILKYGGVQMFRKGRPFFLGMILGQYSAAAVWFLIDLVTGHQGNVVFWV